VGDTPTNHKSFHKLIQSSKTTQNSKPNATMTNTAHTANIIDNNTNEPSQPAQHSDKEATNAPIKNIDTNIYNHDFTNSIQSVSSDKHSLYQNINIESEKQATSKKSFAETTLNATLPKKEQAIVFDSINNKPQIEYIIAISKLIPPKHIKFD